MRNAIFLLALTFMTANILPANEITFQHLTVEDGLSQGNVMDVLQDRLGFMWFATDDGLNRFDGKNFRIYKDFKDDEGVNHNKITCLFEDSEGILWVGTFGGGLYQYNVEKDNWINHVSKPNIPGTISNNNISCITENDEGLWIGTFNNGLNLYDRESGTFQKINLVHTDDGKKALSIFSVLLDKGINLWIGTERNIIIYDTQNKAQLTAPDHSDFISVPGSSTIRSLSQDGSGKIWIGSEKGLFYYERNAIKPFIYPDGMARNFLVRTILEDREKNLWIGFDGEGVGVYNLANQDFYILRSNEDNPQSISNNSIYKVYQSRDGILWFCNYGGGINILDYKKDKFELYQHIRNDPTSLINNNARTIYEDRKGDLWIGTRDGLELFDKKTKTFRHFRHSPYNPRSISASIVLDILEDSFGKFWVGTFAGGLNQLDRKTENFKRYASQEGPNSLSNSNVYKIFEDSYRDLWIGTLNGLNKYNRERDNFSTIPNILGIKELYEDSKNRFLIGGDRGLILFDRRTNAIEKIWPENGKVQVYWITENSKGEILVGTEGSGLLIFNADLSLNCILSEHNYLPNNIIHAVLEDEKQNLWISSNSGLSRFAPDNTIMNFDVSDRLQGREFNNGSCFKGSDGKFYFGGTNGFNAFYPEKVLQNDYIPNVVITRFIIDGQEVGTRPGSVLLQHIPATRKIKLAPHQTSLTFEFSSLNFTNPHKNQYSYFMEGLSDSWSEPSTTSFATFNKIPPGKYTFRVIGSNNDGVWNTIGSNIEIHISPPFWKSIYAILMYFILVTILMLLFKKYTLIGVKEKNKLHLEKLESEKQEELYQMKLTFFTNISHEFRTPLTLILAPIQILSKEYKDDEKLLEQLSLVQRNSTRLLNLVNQLMDFRRIERDKFYELKMVKQDIIPFIKDITLAFKQPSDEKNLKLNFISEIEKCETWFSPDAMDKIMYNLLSNALKFTPENGEIAVLITKYSLPRDTNKSFFSRKKQHLPELNEFIKIIVKNTGQGIDKDKLDKLFNRFYQAGNSGELWGEGSGIGLEFTKSLVNFHLGNIYVESSPEEGTRFYVDIPLIFEPFESKNTNIVFDSSIDPDMQPAKTRIRKYFGQPIPQTNKELGVSRPEKKSIVIVDDDFDMLTFLNGYFRDNYNVYLAKNGEEGFEMVKVIIPDLVIADVMMTKMSGIEMCKLIKEDLITNHIPIILLTAKTVLEYKIEGFDVGADDYITKPFETELLEARVKNILILREKLQAKLGKNLSLEPSDNLVMSADEKFVKSLVALIEKNMDNPEFDVDQIVDQIGMSRAVLYRKIKAMTGLTVIDVVKNIRIKKAAILLKSKKYTISEVATAVGFSDPKYFAKCFKKEYYMSPREYMAKVEE
jgi:signal transduction histidine kinase/ligand-binding sensor domain-containing protein/DNA-binding response OmpR family regulator